MTAQIHDQLVFDGLDYSVIGIEGGPLFEPKKFGFKPRAMHTACYRGYYLLYKIHDNKLILQNATINDAKGNYPPINAVPSQSPDTGEYTDVMLPLNFTGVLIGGRDFIQERYVHMGFQRPYSFKTVKQFQFKDGSLIEVTDISNIVDKFSEPDKRNLLNWIRHRFSLSVKGISNK